MSNLLYLHSISAFHIHEDSSKSTSLSEQDFSHVRSLRLGWFALTTTVGISDHMLSLDITNVKMLSIVCALV